MQHNPRDLTRLITDTVRRDVAEADTVTRYRAPLVVYAKAIDPGFSGALGAAVPGHMRPEELRSRAR
jgi:hypothetical protein